MAFDYFENALANCMTALPNDMYREMEQAFIDEQWDNTSAKTPENGGKIKEQTDIGSSEYRCVQAWVKPTVADVSRGQTDTRDYLKLIFKSIDHETKRGLLYMFDDCYWIVHTYNHFNGLPQDIGIRRCNNALRIIDPENGAIYTEPCVIDYDMMSPNVQISRYVITPNGHITVMCQANENTLRLFTLNKRFVLDGRVFRINAFQNSLEYSVSNAKPTLLLLDMYLDEIQANDDMVNQIADNGKYDYKVNLNSEDMQLSKGASGRLDTTVLLNGQEVDKPIVWNSNNSSVIKIDDNGNYQVIGSVGKSAIITASLEGNTNISDMITIDVVEAAVVTAKLVINPTFAKIRQYETIKFRLEVEFNGQTYYPSDTNIVIKDDGDKYISLSYLDGYYYITCDKISQSLIGLHITVNEYNITEDIMINTVSMMG